MPIILKAVEQKMDCMDCLDLTPPSNTNPASSGPKKDNGDGHDQREGEGGDGVGRPGAGPGPLLRLPDHAGQVPGATLPGLLQDPAVHLEVHLDAVRQQGHQVQDAQGHHHRQRRRLRYCRLMYWNTALKRNLKIQNPPKKFQESYVNNIYCKSPPSLSHM